jgi:hypothetical protein
MNQRLVAWTTASDVFGKGTVRALSDAEFAELKRRGVDAIVAQTGYLNCQNASAPSFGFTDLNGAVRAKAAGIDVLLGYYVVDYNYPNNPFVTGWHLDDRWAKVVTYMTAFAKWAKDHGCVGVAQDSEEYAGVNGIRPNWNVSSPPPGYTQDQFRLLIQRRGGQIMGALTAGFPGLEVVTAYGDLPGSYQEQERRAQANPSASYSAASLLFADFWVGAVSTAGYGRWEWWEEPWFYKGKGTTRPITWDQAVAEHAQKFGAYWATKVVPLDKIGTTIMPWVNGVQGPDPNKLPMSVQTATDALNAAARNGAWSTPMYCQPSLLAGAATLDTQFDWSAYIPVLQAVSGVPTSETLRITFAEGGVEREMLALTIR